MELRPFEAFKFLRFLDIFEFEHTHPRCFRFLSGLFEVIDINWRMWMWKWIPPHPSLSLTFFFTLFLSPILFVGVLKKLGLAPWQQFLGVMLWLSTPATQSLLAMNFRPGKALVQTAIFAVLYYFERRWICALLLVFAPLFDETGVILFPALFLWLWANGNKLRIFDFVVSGGIVYWLYFYGIRELVLLARYKVDRPETYEAIMVIERWFGPNGLHLLFGKPDWYLNIRALLWDSLGIFIPGRSNPGWVWALQAINLLVIAAGIIHLVWRGIMNRIKPSKKIFAMATMIFLSLIMHALLMSTVSNQVWGLYWYGVYLAPFWILGLILLAYEFKTPRFPFVLYVSLLAFLQCYAFWHTNTIYRDEHIYTKNPLTLRRAFEESVNRFEYKAYRSPGYFDEVLTLWNLVRVHPDACVPEAVVPLRSFNDLTFVREEVQIMHCDEK